MSVSIPKDSSGISESFDEAINQVAKATKLLALVASADVKDTASMAPTACFAAKIAKQEVEEAMKDLALTSTLPPLLDSDSSSDEYCKSCRERGSKKKFCHCKSALFY